MKGYVMRCAGSRGRLHLQMLTDLQSIIERSPHHAYTLGRIGQLFSAVSCAPLSRGFQQYL
jgi:hypothetical protein